MEAGRKAWAVALFRPSRSASPTTTQDIARHGGERETEREPAEGEKKRARRGRERKRESERGKEREHKHLGWDYQQQTDEQPTTITQQNM